MWANKTKRSVLITSTTELPTINLHGLHTSTMQKHTLYDMQNLSRCELQKQNFNEKPRALLGLAASCDPDNYEYHACLYPKCTCGIEMSKETRRHKRNNKSWMSTMAQRQWTCSNCQVHSQYKHDYGLFEQLTAHLTVCKPR